MSSRQLEPTISWIIKIGLMAVAFLPLYISTGLLFPYITGRNFLFRISMVILFAIWAGFIGVWPQYRPRLSLLVKFSTVFILVVFLADLFSPNPYRSFFSNYERMEGFMMIFHFWLYFLMVTSMFRTKKDWFLFAHAALLAGLLVGGVGILQRYGFIASSYQSGYRIDATIGNATYLAAYLSFHFWLLVLLLGQSWARMWAKILYALALLLTLFVIGLAGSRGAAIGIFAGSFVLLTASVFYWKKLFPSALSYRKFAAALLLLVTITPLIFWQIRNTSLIPQNSIFSRLASVSLSERTTQSRFYIWGMSLKGFLDRPLLGWGQENYYLVFQKYYDPRLADSEPWFDRSHNIVMDWLVHTGILGAGAFLGMSGAAVYLLLKRIRGNMIAPWKGMVLVVSLISYFVQDLFVFDNFNTYLMLFGTLAFVDVGSGGFSVKDTAGFVSGRRSAGKFYITSALIFILLLPVGYYIYLEPYLQSRATLDAIVTFNKGESADKIIAAFRKAVSYNSSGTTEAREQLANTARDIGGADRLSQDDRRRVIDYAAQELRKEIARPTKDIKHMLFLAALLVRGVGTPEAHTEAQALIAEGLRLSPKKQILYFELGESYIHQKRYKDAVPVLKAAADLYPQWLQANLNLALASLWAGDTSVAEEARKNLRANLTALDDDHMEKFASLFIKANDYRTARIVYKELVRRYPAARYFATLAALDKDIGGFDEEALEVTREAVRLDPTYAQEADIFIKLLKEGKSGSK